MRFHVDNMVDFRQAQRGSVNKLTWWNCQVFGVGEGCQSEQGKTVCARNLTCSVLAVQVSGSLEPPAFPVPPVCTAHTGVHLVPHRLAPLGALTCILVLQ